ncbi:MAG: DUF4231 domain-containing protein [Acidimicrobiia bacterium]
MSPAETTAVPLMTYPVLHHEADATSLWGQRAHLRNIRLELIFLIAGAIAGAVSLGTVGAVDLAGLLAGLFFLAALTMRHVASTQRPEARWYQGRAAAESVKTLAWRYAVGGDPFGLALSKSEVDRLFIARLSDILGDLGDVMLTMVTGSGSQITIEMRTMRELGLEARKHAYASQRIEDQRRWYAAKAAYNTRRLRIWLTVTLALEVAGVGTGLLIAVRLFETSGHLLGIFATMVAAATAWIQTKQHGTLATSYSVAAQELASVSALIEHQTTDEEWERFVGSSEAAISREHTLWRASKTK